MFIFFINPNNIEESLKVEIINEKSKIIYYTNRYIKVKLDEGVYKIKLYNYYGYINTYIFIYKENETLCIYYNFNNIRKIHLTDYHYNNLRIERGTIYLCKKI